MADRREALRRYVGEFVSDRAEQDAIIDTVCARSPEPEDDRWHAREEIAWRVIEAMQADPARTDATFELLYRLFWKVILGRIRGQIGGHSDAEDLAQATFNAAWQYRQHLKRSRGAISGWLGTVADRLVADWWRRQQRQRRLPQPPPHPSSSACGSGQAMAFWANVFCLGAPHQSLVLLLMQHLRVRPAEVVATWSRSPLREIANFVERQAYQVEEFVDDAVLERAFALLYARLDLPVGSSNAPEDHARLQAIWDRPAGDVVLAAYCGENPAANVSNWSYRLGRHIRVTKLRECPDLFDPQEAS